MRYECELIRDLMPLVKDGAASTESAAAVKRHMAECSECRDYYESIGEEINLPGERPMDWDETGQAAALGKKIRRRRVKTAVIIVSAVLVLLTVQAVLLFSAMGLITIFGDEYTTNDISKYGVFSGHIVKEEEGFFSRLLIFPKKMPESAEIAQYYYNCSNKGLDNFYQIFVKYTLSPEEYAREKQRLSALSMTYRGETRHVQVEAEGFSYPAYVTVFGNNYTYEYALADDAAYTIMCIFSQHKSLDKMPVDDKYLPDTLPEQERDGYSMYYFSIGNGVSHMPRLDEYE